MSFLAKCKSVATKVDNKSLSIKDVRQGVSSAALKGAIVGGVVGAVAVGTLTRVVADTPRMVRDSKRFFKKCASVTKRAYKDKKVERLEEKA